jgi:OOP family OmpA-OmpF porin
MGGAALGLSYAGPWIVLFDSGRSRISRAGQLTIEDFLAWARNYQSPPKIILRCYADRAGPERYNLALSNDRCEAVRDVLLRAGTRPDTIILSPRGELDLPDPTPDGVPSQTDRSVWIDFL